MDAVTDWVKKLIFIILFTTLLEMFLPENNMRKYVRIVLGFFIVTIFISPLAAIFNQDLSTMYRIVPGKMIDDNWEEIKKRGDEISESNQDILMDYYGERIGERVEEVVNLNFADWRKEIKVEVNNEYKLTGIDINLVSNKIIIKPVKIGGDEEDEPGERNKEARVTELKHNLSQIFQLPLQKINVRISGGDQDGLHGEF